MRSTADGFEGCSSAHQFGQENTIAQSAATVAPPSSARRWSSPPSSTTSRQAGDAVPAWPSIALWNFSAPAADARHWKNSSPAAPRASAW